MKYFPREIVDCYLDKCYKELLKDTSEGKTVYVASVAKDLQQDYFYIERGFIKKNGVTGARMVPFNFIEILKECIKEHPECKHGIRKEGIDFNDENIYIENKEVDSFSLQVTRRKIRPAAGGCSIGRHNSTGESGTLGAILKLKSRKRPFIISNYHVMCGAILKYDNLIFQPSPGYTGKYIYDNVIAKVKYGKFDKFTDVAFAEILNKEDVQGGFISDSVVNPQERKINGLGIPKIDQKVHKYGTSTYKTCGEIKSLNTYVKFTNPWNSSINEIVKKQILTNVISKDGDSGSLLLNEQREAVGLLIGGDGKTFSVYNNFKYIFNVKYPNMKRKLKFEKFI